MSDIFVKGSGGAMGHHPIEPERKQIQEESDPAGLGPAEASTFAAFCVLLGDITLSSQKLNLSASQQQTLQGLYDTLQKNGAPDSILNPLEKFIQAEHANAGTMDDFWGAMEALREEFPSFQTMLTPAESLQVAYGVTAKAITNLDTLNDQDQLDSVLGSLNIASSFVKSGGDGTTASLMLSEYNRLQAMNSDGTLLKDLQSVPDFRRETSGTFDSFAEMIQKNPSFNDPWAP